MNGFERKLLDSPALPTLPSVAQRILELVTDERTSVTQLASVISCDPSLSTRVLGLINSPMYRMNREVVSLREAVLYLGLNSVRSVALSFTLISSLRGDRESSRALDNLWRTSLMNALAARRLASETGGWDAEEAFLAGLVADCGSLLMFKMVPSYRALVQRFHQGEADLLDLERANIDSDHMRVTALLAAKWNFPDAFRRLIAAHHDPSLLEAGSREEHRARILNAAWLVARALTVPGFVAESASLDQHVSVLLGLAPPLVRAIASELPDEVREAARFFEIPMEDQKSFEDLLEQANQSLAELALRAEQTSSELADTVASKDGAFEELGRELSEGVDTDASGLVSRGGFERMLDAFHRRARQVRNSIGIMLIEVAELKPIEGACRADVPVEVLAEIAERTARCLRGTDRIAHFGERQLAVLVPGCAIESLRRAGDRVQRGIESAPIDTGSGLVDCQVGIGLAASTPDRDGLDPRSLLRLACSAVDRSRSSPDRIVVASGS
jgi:diguanylate cyclase (GGDEF)-like protein